MPKYVMLSTLTPKGTQTLQANPDRLKEVNRDVEELAAPVLHQWAMVGAYDFLNVIEAPDAKTMARISVALGARGSMRFQTFELVEIDELLEQLSASLLVFLARHAESILNLERRVNGDPSVAVPLTDKGRDEARLLGAQLANLELDLCVPTRFPRTKETAELAVAGRGVPVEVEPRLDDINIGDLDGSP